jgi:hypothetical protein
MSRHELTAEEELGLVRSLSKKWSIRTGWGTEFFYDAICRGIDRARRKYDKSRDATLKTFAWRCAENAVADELKGYSKNEDYMAENIVFTRPSRPGNLREWLRDIGTEYAEVAWLALQAPAELLDDLRPRFVKAWVRERLLKMGWSRDRINGTYAGLAEKVKEL